MGVAPSNGRPCICAANVNNLLALPASASTFHTDSFIHWKFPVCACFSRSGLVAGDCDVLLFLPNIKTSLPGFISFCRARAHFGTGPYFPISFFHHLLDFLCPVRDKSGPSRLRSCSVRRHAGHCHRRAGRHPLLYVFVITTLFQARGDSSALTHHSRQQLLGQGRCRSLAAPGAHAQCEADVRRAARILQR